MISNQDGTTPKKTLAEMDQGDLLRLDFGLLTEEEQKEWFKLFDEAPLFKGPIY